MSALRRTGAPGEDGDGNGCAMDEKERVQLALAGRLLLQVGGLFGNGSYHSAQMRSKYANQLWAAGVRL